MTPQEHANAVWRAGASPESLAGAITAYTEEIRGELHRANEEVERLRERLVISPGGDDRIDELESASEYLKSDITTLTAENAALREEVARLTNESRNVPLCGDHAGTWFTARRFKPGECWFCQQEADLTASRARCAELEGALKAMREYYREYMITPILYNQVEAALSLTSEEGK